MFDYIAGINIGFCRRSQTVSEADTLPFQDDFIISTCVHAMNSSDTMYNFIVHVLETSSSTATVNASSNRVSRLMHIDAIFGTSQTLERHFISGGEDLFIPLRITNDFIPEEQECFTLQIIPPDALSCNEDEDNASDYFCLHTICIEDDDTNGLCTTMLLMHVDIVCMGVSK